MSEATTLTEPAAKAPERKLHINVRDYALLGALVTIVLFFQLRTEGKLLLPANINNLISQNAYVVILAIGMVMVIIAGHIDLSVGSLVAMIGAISAIAIKTWDQPVWVSILLALAIGAAVGAWQGYWVAFVKVPAFIVTLAGMLIFRGATMVTLGNTQISPFPDAFRDLASGYINGWLGGPGFDVFTLVIAAVGVAAFAWTQLRARMASQKYGQEVGSISMFALKIAVTGLVVMWFAWQLANYAGLPIVLVILGALVIMYNLVTRKSTFGRNVYAIGGNLQAAMLSGVKVKWVNFFIFVNMGVLAALAGIIFTARLNLANPKAGTMFELDAIAACFIGGAAVTGGVGTVIGAIVGGLIMGVMNNGMSLLGIGIDYQQAIKGLVLLFAVAFDVVNKRRAGTR